MHKNWNELKHVLVHVTFHVIYFRRDQLKGYFGTLGIYTILCWSSDAPPHQSYRILNFWLLPLCKRLCHHLPDVVLSVCLLGWTHTLLKCNLESLSVLMLLNSGMPEVLQDLRGLLRIWSVRLRRRPMWNASVLSVGCSIMDDEALCSGLLRCEFV